MRKAIYTWIYHRPYVVVDCMCTSMRACFNRLEKNIDFLDDPSKYFTNFVKLEQLNFSVSYTNGVYC